MSGTIFSILKCCMMIDLRKVFILLQCNVFGQCTIRSLYVCKNLLSGINKNNEGDSKGGFFILCCPTHSSYNWPFYGLIMLLCTLILTPPSIGLVSPVPWSYQYLHPLCSPNYQYTSTRLHFVTFKMIITLETKL